MEEKYDSGNTQLLKNPVSFIDLINSGVHFEVDIADHNTVPYDDIDFDDSNVDDDFESENLVSPWTRSFDELRQLMVPINEHMYKRITRAGIEEGGLVPENARVEIRYSGYFEGEGAPFDSSVLRGTKFEFETGKGAVIEGLEMAVATMYSYEQAEFILSYKVVYGELGCPPRIKPHADVLFKIELLNFAIIGDVKALDDVCDEDRDKFEMIYPKALEIRLHGKACAKRGSYSSAARSFERAAAALNYCRLANDEEERKQIELLITLYTNLLVCYNKLEKPSRVCTVMKAVRRLTDNKPSCKALFQEGRALINLGEYPIGRKILMQAQKLSPNNTEINHEIMCVEERIREYKAYSREIWSRALGTANKQNQAKVDETSIEESLEKLAISDEENTAFISEMREIMEEFMNSTSQTLNFDSSPFSQNQVDFVRLLAKERNINLILPTPDNEIITWIKPTNAGQE